MNKLFSASLVRWRKNWFFWLTLLGLLFVSVLSSWNYSLSAAGMAQAGLVRTLDNYFFSMAPYMGALFAAFISLFLSAEFADGTVRNKLIVGHTRSHIYLTDYLVCFGACLAYEGMWFLGSAAGLLWIGPFSMTGREVVLYLLAAVGFAASFASLFVLVNLFSGNKAMTVILSLAVWVGLALLAGAVYDRLAEPEWTGGMYYYQGTLQEVAPTPNQLYLSGTVRMLCSWFLEFLPTGQAQLMRNAEIDSPVRLILLSVLFTAIVLWAGLQLFQHKDIK